MNKKLIVLLLATLFVAGCAQVPLQEGSLMWIQHQCELDRAKAIRAEWWSYELNNHLIVLNNWKLNARPWAEYECKTGMQAPGSHPPRGRRVGGLGRY